jgi:hypothetical protein
VAAGCCEWPILGACRQEMVWFLDVDAGSGLDHPLADAPITLPLA